jgi:hypothetical protein
MSVPDLSREAAVTLRNSRFERGAERFAHRLERDPIGRRGQFRYGGCRRGRRSAGVGTAPLTSRVRPSMPE